MRTACLTRTLLILSVILFSAVLLPGCASPAMKGTPFYEGEARHPADAMQSRVNIWPLAYYYDPFLSIMWPIYEKTDTQWAIRPIFAKAKLDKPDHEYSVLWPLGDFDNDTKDYRFFPFYWGKMHNGNPYFFLFPLTWYEKNDSFCVIPLWWYFAAHGNTPASYTLFPLFWYQRDHHFAIFPFYTHMPKSKSTNILWPLVHFRNDEKSPGWRVAPFIGDYKWDDKRYSFLLWPLGHRYREGDKGTDVFVPLYVNFYDKSESTVLSPLYIANKNRDTGESTRFIAPTYIGHTDANSNMDCLFPLYFGLQKGDENIWLTPLVGQKTTADSKTLILSPLLTSYTSAADHKEMWALAPISRFRWGTDQRNTSHILPLYYYDEKERLFLSLLYSQYAPADGSITRVVPPLLTAYTSAPDRKSLWAPAPLAHFQWGMGGKENFILPFYYYSEPDNTFLSLLYAQKKDNDSVTRVIPPLLTGWKKTDKDTSLWSPFPLVWNRWGPNERQACVIPLFYWNAITKTFVSLPYSAWGDNDERYHAFFGPLFAHEKTATTNRGFFLWPFTSFGKTEYGHTWWVTLFMHYPTKTGSETWLPFPLVRFYKNDVNAGSWFFPLWSYNHKKPFQPKPQIQIKMSKEELAALEENPVTDETDFSLLLFLYTHTSKDDTARSRILWYLMDYKRDGQKKSLDVFPFVSYDRDEGAGYSRFSFLWRFFRNQHDPDGSHKMDILFIPIVRN